MKPIHPRNPNRLAQINANLLTALLQHNAALGSMRYSAPLAIREILNHLNISLRDLARYLECSVALLSRVIGKQPIPPSPTLTRKLITFLCARGFVINYRKPLSNRKTPKTRINTQSHSTSQMDNPEKKPRNKKNTAKLIKTISTIVQSNTPNSINSNKSHKNKKYKK